MKLPENKKWPFSSYNQENYVRTPEEKNEFLGTITAQGANSRQKILTKLKYEELLTLEWKGEIWNVRVITPKEALLLMGFKKEDYQKIEHLKESTKYYVAGNSIVVPVAEYVINSLIPKNENLRVLELFAGIGAIAKALKNLKYKISEILPIEFDKKVIEAYNLIHDTVFIKNDILEFVKYLEEVSKVSDLKNRYNYIHMSLPCQSFSVAGKGLGAEDERGAPLWEATLKIMKLVKPKYFTFENVKGVLSKKHKPYFDWFVNELKEIGYSIDIEVLNAKDFEIPQNRERVFLKGKYND